MCLRLEFEQSHIQLLHSPTAYTLKEAFALVLVEETRLRTSTTGTGIALGAQHFKPPPVVSVTPLPSPRPPASSWTLQP